MDTRTCAGCGKPFEPPREHSRFCSAGCRVAWNRDPLPQASALEWAVLGMRDTTDRLGKVRPLDSSQAFAVIGEAVWWVTIVDATMIRYHPQTYEAALAGLSASDRQRTEGVFGGLRFVRNRMGYHADHADFIQPEPGPGRIGEAPITAWRWKPRPKPTLDPLPPRNRGWELRRYRAYQRWLAGQTIGRTFCQAAGFLTLAVDLAGGEDAAVHVAGSPSAPLGTTPGAGRLSRAGQPGLVSGARPRPGACGRLPPRTRPPRGRPTGCPPPSCPAPGPCRPRRNAGSPAGRTPERH